MWFARFQWKRRHATTIPAILSIVKLHFQSSLSYVDSNPCNIITTIAIPDALAFLYESMKYFDFLTIESRKDLLFFALTIWFKILHWNRFKIRDCKILVTLRKDYYSFWKKERKSEGMANWCHQKLFKAARFFTERSEDI